MENIYTPWGMSDHVEDHALGVKFYSTPSHGGFKVPADTNTSLIPSMFRQDGWYEEDCDAWIVIHFVPGVHDKWKDHAVDHIKRWYPNEWKQYEMTLKHV